MFCVVLLKSAAFFFFFFFLSLLSFLRSASLSMGFSRAKSPDCVHNKERLLFNAYILRRTVAEKMGKRGYLCAIKCLASNTFYICKRNVPISFTKLAIGGSHMLRHKLYVVHTYIDSLLLKLCSDMFSYFFLWALHVPVLFSFPRTESVAIFSRDRTRAEKNVVMKTGLFIYLFIYLLCEAGAILANLFLFLAVLLLFGCCCLFIYFRFLSLFFVHHPLFESCEHVL